MKFNAYFLIVDFSRKQKSIEKDMISDMKLNLSRLFVVQCLSQTNVEASRDETRSPVRQSRTFLDPAEIFKGEVEEILVRVNTALKVLHAFRQTYDDHRVRVRSYFKNDRPAKEWEFAPELIFHRYNRFVERVEMVLVSARFAL